MWQATVNATIDAEAVPAGMASVISLFLSMMFCLLTLLIVPTCMILDGAILGVVYVDTHGDSTQNIMFDY